MEFGLLKPVLCVNRSLDFQRLFDDDRVTAAHFRHCGPGRYGKEGLSRLQGRDQSVSFRGKFLSQFGLARRRPSLGQEVPGA